MHPAVRALLAAQHGVASTQQLQAAGVSRFQLRRMVQTGGLIRLRRGILVDPTIWQDAAPWDRHAIRARGLVLGPAGAPGSPTALSHHSALCLMGIALHGVDDRVHVVRTDGRRGQTDDFVQCHAPVDASATGRLLVSWAAYGPDSSEPEALRWAGDDTAALASYVRVMRPAHAILQVARTFGVEAGLVSADCGLRTGAVTAAELKEVLTATRMRNGALDAETVVQFADALAESAGESRCRWLFSVLGLPPPVLQAVIRDRTGQFVGRVDFLFEAQRTIVEFDGLGKYTDRDSVVSEKQREDALRACGYSVVRITWEDLAHPHRVLAKVRQGFQSAAA